jgi:ribosomal protein S18 acetylase RimI-like enzyme
MNGEIIFRGFKPEDYTEIEELWRTTELLSFPDSRKIYEKNAEKHPDQFIVAEINNQIVGTVYGFIPYFIGSLIPDTIGYIGHLAVHPDHQGKSLGSQLLKEICRRHKLNDKKRVFLFINPINKRKKDLQRFYCDKHGFKKILYLYHKKI